MSVLRGYNTEKIRCVFYAIPIYISLNVILYVLGLSNSSGTYYAVGSAKLLSFITGIDIQRAYFPLSQGINAFGVVAGLGLVLSFFLYLSKKSYANFLLVTLNTIGLLLADSRGAFIAVVLTIMLYAARFKFCRILVLLSPLYSLFALSIYITVQLVFPALVRSTTSILSGREIIWESAISGLSRFSIVELAVGYGYLGQAASKVYEDYSSLFSDRNSTSEVFGSFHSSFIQTFYDIGILGLVSIITILFIIVTKADRYTKHANLYISFILYSIFSGAFDMTLNIYNQYIFIVFIMMLFAFISEVNHAKTSCENRS
ncbi:O-antigen ligase family protein [Photobacterium sp. MCCC 1A19761]|uniref:O-antigen ligase family protein n=1 Tax=Photobacterium sp. MCCC 1A19761 TaxID=3115000 RepID=UPI00307F1C04